jgi:hypothetical protein
VTWIIVGVIIALVVLLVVVVVLGLSRERPRVEP